MIIHFSNYYQKYNILKREILKNSEKKMSLNIYFFNKEYVFNNRTRFI
jgi:hypothetical protein